MYIYPHSSHPHARNTAAAYVCSLEIQELRIVQRQRRKYRMTAAAVSLCWCVKRRSRSHALSCTLAHICIRVSIIASRTYVFLEAFLSTKLSQKINDTSFCRPRKIPHPPVVSYAVQYETQPSVLLYVRLVCADPLPVFV